jgi:hypothetical protein
MEGSYHAQRVYHAQHYADREWLDLYFFKEISERKNFLLESKSESQRRSVVQCEGQIETEQKNN